jgi:hypothetical protein
MKTENCAEITDAKSIELKSGLTEPAQQNPYGGFIIPAGILIGLGVGLLVDHMFSGFLIGLGFGCIGSELLNFARQPRENECPHREGVNEKSLLFGAFLIFIGISFVWMPAAIWPYAIAGFLILTGIWLLVRGFSRTS